MQMKEELPLFLDFLKLNGNNVYDEHRNIFPLLVYYFGKKCSSSWFHWALPNINDVICA